MNLDIQVTGLARVQKALDALSGPQAREAYAKALNDAAFVVRRDMQRELRAVFDRPTPFITNAPKVFAATADKLEAYVAPTMDSRNRPSKGGKVGVDPQDVLQAQEFGGRRREKRSEVALRRAGILPSGWQTALPRVPFPGSDDGRGNLRGPFIAQLISYFQAFGEQGYRANMTARRKAALARGSAKQSGRRYFVSYGKLRGQHLAAGIWAAQGTGGVDVRPVVMFTRPGTYRPRISMARIARALESGDYLARRMRFRIRQAAGM